MHTIKQNKPLTEKYGHRSKKKKHMALFFTIGTTVIILKTVAIFPSKLLI